MWWDFDDDVLKEIGNLVPLPELFLEEAESKEGNN